MRQGLGKFIRKRIEQFLLLSQNNEKLEKKFKQNNEKEEEKIRFRNYSENSLIFIYLYYIFINIHINIKT